jgi:hypothetical protein
MKDYVNTCYIFPVLYIYTDLGYSIVLLPLDIFFQFRKKYIYVSLRFRQRNFKPMKQNHVYQKPCYNGNFPMNIQNKRINTSTVIYCINFIRVSDDKSLL